MFIDSSALKIYQITLFDDEGATQVAFRKSLSEPMPLQICFDSRVFLHFDLFAIPRLQNPFYFLFVAGTRRAESIPFRRILVLYEIQIASSRIWTLVDDSTFSDVNLYATSASCQLHGQTKKEKKAKCR